MERTKIAESDGASLARVLRKVDFFVPMTFEQLEIILPCFEVCKCANGETIFRQGSPGDSFYVIDSGTVSVRIKKSFFSFSREAAKLGTGDFFGEMALLSRDPRSATVVSVSDTKLFRLHADDFQNVVKRNSAFAAEIKKIADKRKAGRK